MALTWQKIGAITLLIIGLAVSVKIYGDIYGETKDAAYSEVDETIQVIKGEGDPDVLITEESKTDKEMGIAFGTLLETFDHETTKSRCLFEATIPAFREEWKIIFRPQGEQTATDLRNDLNQIKRSALTTRTCVVIKDGRQYQHTNSPFALVQKEEDSIELSVGDNTHELSPKEYLVKRGNTICFFADCDEDCFRDYYTSENLDFCDGRFEETFYQKTYYGSAEDWRRSGSRMKYVGKKEDGTTKLDQRVPTTYAENGLSFSQFHTAFDFQADFANDPDRQGPPEEGVWFEGNYYDQKENWCYQPKKRWWNFFQNNKWRYTGTHPEVHDTEILPQFKEWVFGPPQADPNNLCEAEV